MVEPPTLELPSQDNFKMLYAKLDADSNRNVTFTCSKSPYLLDNRRDLLSKTSILPDPILS